MKSLNRFVLTVPQAAKFLGIGRSSAYDAARRGELPTISFGRRKLVPVTAVERLLGLEEGSLLGADATPVQLPPQ